MQVSVDLKGPFSYSMYPIIIVIIIIILVTIYYFKKKGQLKNNIEEIIPPTVKKIDMKTIQRKYIKKLEILQTKLKNNKISVRKAYQVLSKIIRYFVFEVTNIKVQNYTLYEIEKLEMPALSELIQEYYAPEFSKNSIGNIKDSIEKTRKVIEKWN